MDSSRKECVIDPIFECVNSHRFPWQRRFSSSPDTGSSSSSDLFSQRFPKLFCGSQLVELHCKITKVGVATSLGGPYPALSP